MMAKSNLTKQEEFRKRKTDAGLVEVRGVWIDKVDPVVSAVEKEMLAKQINKTLTKLRAKSK